MKFYIINRWYIASYTLDKEDLVTMKYKEKTATTKRITKEEKKLLQKKTITEENEPRKFSYSNRYAWKHSD